MANSSAMSSSINIGYFSSHQDCSYFSHGKQTTITFQRQIILNMFRKPYKYPDIHFLVEQRNMSRDRSCSNTGRKKQEDILGKPEKPLL